jgi:phosphoribosylanthranilate isomerase
MRAPRRWGFVFYKKSPRYLSPSKAAKIIQELPPFVVPVGVFVNLSEGAVRQIARFCYFQTLQLHGDESPGLANRLSRDFHVIKAFRLGPAFDWGILPKYQSNAYLFDAHQEGQFGGTGQTVEWSLLKREFDRPIILSGGLRPDNVLAAIKAVNPYAVDVSSGVEKSPGQKHPKLLKEFLERVNSYD